MRMLASILLVALAATPSGAFTAPGLALRGSPVLQHGISSSHSAKGAFGSRDILGGAVGGHAGAAKRAAGNIAGNVCMLAPGLIASSSVLGGALAGGLHAVSGPDHFPALLPRCVGKAWLAAGKVGAIWGAGHALSAMAMGLFAFLVKDKAFATSKLVKGVSFGADIAIGLSLILIGAISLYEARSIDFSAQMVEARSQEKQTLAMKANVLINGIFHGLALDGIPTLMPVLGLGSLNNALAFLAAYGFGVMAAMVGATIIIGQSTTSLAKRKADFDLSVIIKGSAFAAIIIGILWTARAVMV